MADELDLAVDPALEQHLRDTFHAEADSIPFALRADTVRRVGVERRRTRRARRFGWLAAAAAVVVVVTGVAALSHRGASQIAAPTLADLPSFDQLVAAGGGGTELARGEADAAPADGQRRLDLPGGSGPVEVVVACSAGSGVTIVAADGASPINSVSADCTGVAVDLRDVGGEALAASASPSIFVGAPAGTAWRIVVLDPADAVRATVGPDGLLPFSALRGQLHLNGVIAALAGESAAAGTARQQTVGVLPASRTVVVALSCVGGPITVQILAGARELNSSTLTCDTRVNVLDTDGTELGTGTGPGGQGTLVVVADPGARWRIVAGVDNGPAPSPTGPAEPPASASPDAGLPTEAALLAAAGQGAVELSTAEATAAAAQATGHFGTVSHRVQLGIVAACAGGDQLLVVDLDVWNANPTAESALGTVTCDGTPQVVSWQGGNRVVSAGPNLGVIAPAGAAYRAVLADTSRVPQEGAQPLAPSDLPPVSQMVLEGPELRAAALTRESTTPAAASGWTTVADIRVAAGFEALASCLGGQADLRIEDSSGGGHPLGSIACDGTVQMLPWARADGPSDASGLSIGVTAGIVWRVVVTEVGAAHPTPAVPCGSTAGLTWAPLPTLVQNGKAIGTLPSYSTSSWGNASDDGVPVAPSTALAVRAGDPMQLRIAGNVCATSWTVLYGTARSDGMGIDPVGALALWDPHATTAGNPENRIDLASLPSGDWVIEVTLEFDNGSGVGLMRVHVP